MYFYSLLWVFTFFFLYCDEKDVKSLKKTISTHWMCVKQQFAGQNRQHVVHLWKVVNDCECCGHWNEPAFDACDVTKGEDNSKKSLQSYWHSWKNWTNPETKRMLTTLNGGGHFLSQECFKISKPFFKI